MTKSMINHSPNSKHFNLYRMIEKNDWVRKHGHGKKRPIHLAWLVILTLAE